MKVIQDQVAAACVDYFNRFRCQTYTASKSCFHFFLIIKTFSMEKCKDIGKLTERMNTGSKKLTLVAEEMLKLKESAAIIIAAQLQRATDSFKALVNPISADKAAGRPSHLIMHVMDFTVILFQRPMKPINMDHEKPCPKPSWIEPFKLMVESYFLNSLVNFPKVKQIIFIRKGI
ncbi:unnamed protein product [Rotaria sp. Silwood2]|nr:unnamed protein product [Rotaria sp. Silwood2]CAF4464524.1 unnamed protein product [Rotaria sp. Silwood2]